MITIVAAVANPRVRDYVRGSISAFAQVEFYRSRRELLEACAFERASVVLTSFDPERETTVERFVRQVVEKAPATPVVAIATLLEGDLRALLPAARAGLAEMVIAGDDDLWQVIRRLARSEPYESSVAEALRAVRPVLDDARWAPLEHCIRHARDGLTVSGWAASVGVRRNTLLHQLGRGGLPGPLWFLTWGRLLVAIQLIAAHGWSGETTAAELRFSSASALRKSLVRHAGVRPKDVRDDGIGLVLPRFVREIGGCVPPASSVTELEQPHHIVAVAS